MNERLTVIVRTVGERTTDLCVALIRQQIQESNISLVRESPNVSAIRKCYEVALAANREWTLIVDADILIRPLAIQDLVAYAEHAGDEFFKIEAIVLDKFLHKPRSAGVYLYRTRLLPIAIHCIPGPFDAIRPDSHIRDRMEQQGYPAIHSNVFVGIHDYEQFYSDIYRKTFIYAKKHYAQRRDIIPLWERLAERDDDYRLALQGFLDGESYDAEIAIDSNAPFMRDVDAILARLGLREKSDDVAVSYRSDVNYLLFACARLLDYYERRNNDVNALAETAERLSYSLELRVGRIVVGPYRCMKLCVARVLSAFKASRAQAD